MYFEQIVLILLCLAASRGLRSIPQYARDFSEHCKRRDALPSVFLSRRVMEADAQVLHFSRLDMPYSCFTTVRTEAGHSIIMVIELSRDDLRKEVCNDGYQIGVFEFAETFGGYWGPIPDAVLKQDPEDPVYTKQYTLASKPPPVTTSTTKHTIRTSTASSSSKATASTQDYITIDVPLVNLTGNLEPFAQLQKPFDIDEFFDDFYDVVPRPGEPYKTSILPLVQIAVKEQDSARAGGGEPRYELDYAVGPFTPDHRFVVCMTEAPHCGLKLASRCHRNRFCQIHRLTTPAWSAIVNTNRNSNRWKKKKLQDKRVHPKTNNSLHARDPANSRKLKQFSLPTTIHRRSYEPIIPQAVTKQPEAVKEKEPYNLIDNIMKSLNKSGILKTQEQSTNSDVLAIFNKTEDSYRNLSVYLEPFPTYAFLPVSDLPVNFTHIKSIYLQGTTENIRNTNQYQDLLENISKKVQSLDHPNDTQAVESITKETITMPSNEKGMVKLVTLTGVETSSSLIETSSTPSAETSVHENQEIRSAIVGAVQPFTDDFLIPVISTERSLSGSLVDHESWENVVQSAPVMAGLLNQHGSELGSPSYLKSGDDIPAQNKRRSRRRRHIAAIMVDDARPHRLATTSMPVIRASVFNAIDVHELARLMELPDDQMNNHVTIKLDPKTNTQLFNVCNESNGTTSRFLVVFNSSRIILSISNFTMPHVMVTLTTARPLALQELQCPETLVECQVEGTRLCIESTNACNGIPNCGSAYAYDEDRVLCGVIDNQRSVYLAAATCLAVLITMLFITHYWLRRCVPNVAEAFFVYSDSADNELYLDSIMRSPMDVGGDQYMYNSALFDEENMLYPSDIRKSKNIFKRVLSSVLPKLTLFKPQESVSKLLEMQGVGRSVSREVPRNSFTESDFRSMMSAGRDQEVQTGESLEMAYLKVMNSLKDDESDERPTKRRLPSVHTIVLRDFLKSQITDTSSDSSGPAGGSTGVMSRPFLDEKEIQSTLYDPGTSKPPEPANIKSSGTGTKQGTKCLRFNERTTFIPRTDDDGDEPAETVELSTGKQPHKKNDENNSEHGVSDFRNFFRKKKDHK